MLTPIKWIKEYVENLDTTNQEFADKMTLSGSKVETFEDLNKCFDKVVVCEILKIEKHPDADKLVVCQVNIGNSVIQIVTAAKNVFEGAKVPVVLVGGYVSDGEGGILKIKKGKLRGVQSDGMFCSIHELGKTPDMFPEAADDGIYIFDGDVEIGSDVAKALDLDDTVFEYEITSNRVDCFGIYGIAREVAATYRLPLKKLDIKSTGNNDYVDNFIKVEVKNSLCKRYVSRVVKNVKIETSPTWLRHKLMSVGIKPINNIVDITNFVMMELGQPMHAFNIDDISGKKIIVDVANDNETFITLDGEERKLDSNILMIKDESKSIAIAGIMGGNNSKITTDVNTVVLESACFDGTNIRLSSKKLGLRTESSAKFEKGLDPNACLDAINRACQLIDELNAGEVIGGVIDIYDTLPKKRNVPFDLDRCNKVLGNDIKEDVVMTYFERLELSWDKANGMVTVPTYRQDLERMADLIEEVARFYGYDNIPTTLPNIATQGGYSDKFKLQNKLTSIMLAYGYNETMTYSFEGKSVFNKLNLAGDDYRRKAVEIMNPLGEEYAIMRTIPYNGILNSLSTNFNNRNEDIKLFEYANTYLPTDEALPNEELMLTIANIDAGDFFDMKGILETIFEDLGFDKKVRYNADFEASYLHPGRKAQIVYNNTVIGELGEVHPEVLDNYNINKKAYIASLNVAKLLEYKKEVKKYTHIARFPSSTRDLCFVMDKDVSVIVIEDIIDKNSKNILESYALFDLYEGDKIGFDKKSVTYKLTFRADDRTLKDDEINKIVDKILKDLERVNITLRN